MLSATERIILRIAATEAGFVSERDLSRSQIRTARGLIDRKLLRLAGEEPDRTKVYGITDHGRETLEKWG